MNQPALYIHEETLQHHAYILLCQLLSMHDFEKLAYYPGCDDAVNRLMGIGEQELNKNIMTLAALSRANDDHRSGLTIHSSQVPRGVGQLIKEGRSETLTARDACNKIIHNTSVKLEFEKTSKNPLYAEVFETNGIVDEDEYLIPILSIEGSSQSGKPWIAKINMIQWIFAVAYFGSA